MEVSINNLKSIFPTEFLILVSLLKFEGAKATIYDLALELNYSKSTLYYNVYKLQLRGLVRAENGYIQLTSEGKRIINEIRKLICKG